jgi:hypothetical protein
VTIALARARVLTVNTGVTIPPTSGHLVFRPSTEFACGGAAIPGIPLLDSGLGEISARSCAQGSLTVLETGESPVIELIPSTGRATITRKGEKVKVALARVRGAVTLRVKLTNGRTTVRVVSTHRAV